MSKSEWEIERDMEEAKEQLVGHYEYFEKFCTSNIFFLKLILKDIELLSFGFSFWGQRTKDKENEEYKTKIDPIMWDIEKKLREILKILENCK